MGFLQFLGLFVLLVIIIKLVIWTISLILSKYGRRFGCGVKWTTDQGEYIVIAGACGDIGSEYAREFASMGFNLILIGRNAEKLQTLAESFQDRRYPVFDIQILEADFALPDFEETIRDALSEVSPIVGLVNALGVSYSAKKFTEIGADNIKDMIMINVMAPTMLIDIVLPKMSQAQRGVIINLSSQCAKLKMPYYSVFSATKSYIHCLSEALSFEYVKRGVTIQNVSPLFTTSNMAAEIKASSLRVSSALSVFSAMQTVGIESTSYGYWSHRLFALLCEILIFFFGVRITTRLMTNLLPRYIRMKAPSRRGSHIEEAEVEESDEPDEEDQAKMVSKKIKKVKKRKTSPIVMKSQTPGKKESMKKDGAGSETSLLSQGESQTSLIPGKSNLSLDSTDSRLTSKSSRESNLSRLTLKAKEIMETLSKISATQEASVKTNKVSETNAGKKPSDKNVANAAARKGSKIKGSRKDEIKSKSKSRGGKKDSKLKQIKTGKTSKTSHRSNTGLKSRRSEEESPDRKSKKSLKQKRTKKEKDKKKTAAAKSKISKKSLDNGLSVPETPKTSEK